MGAWIETKILGIASYLNGSHPVWVRGLKLLYIIVEFLLHKSHPVWVRGLKHIVVNILNHLILSHPVWVRGLKPSGSFFYAPVVDVAPRVGAWIETIIRVWIV